MVRIMPISDKQKAILAFPYTDYKCLIADGAIRSGKTMFMIMSFVRWAMENFSGQRFGICGKTVNSAKKNIIEPYLAVRYDKKRYDIRWNVSDKTMTITYGSKKNVFEVFGGKDDSSYQLIQGRTLAGVLLDEVALMPQNFVLQAISRCSVEGSRLWFNCNPESPSHWFYNEWIKNPEAHNALHLHFLLEDNPSLSEDKIAEYKSWYTGTFYQRYILGLWVHAEGLIYRRFADDMSSGKTMIISTTPQISRIVIGVDFGGSGSAHTFVCTGTDRGYNRLYGLLSERIECKDSSGEQIEIDPEQLGQMFCDFVQRVIMMFGPPDRVCCDSAEQTLILGLRSTARKRGLGWLKIENALKTSINDRIRAAQRLMAQGRFFIMEQGCESLIKALETAVWDPKSIIVDKRLDDGTSDIDTLDAFEYTFERDISQFIRLE